MTAPPIVTSLYVPGDRPDRFDKAVASGTQLVILDLEDAVAPERKAQARGHVSEWLRRRGRDDGPLVEVRINPGSAEDLAWLVRTPGSFGVRIPKVADVDDVDRVVSALAREVRITALIESAAGIENAPQIARHPSVTSLTVGEADLASDLGTSHRGALDWAHLRVLFAARAAGKPPPAAPVYTRIDDLAGLAEDTATWRAMGFLGRAAVHPTQVAVIAAAFRPGAEELAWAEQVLAATAGGGVARLPSGDMVDPAMRGRAEAIVALGALGSAG